MADFEVGTLTPEQCRLLWQDFQTRRQLQPQLQQNFPQRPLIDEPSPHRVFVKNESGDEVPAFGCMQVTGTVTENGRAFIKVTKPTTICGEYIFCGPYKIAPGGYGWGYAWGVVRMLGTANEYSSCKRYKPSANQWTVSEGAGPFVVYGADEEISGTVIGRIVGDKCKADAIKFTYNSDSPSPVTVDAFYSGPNPSLCGDVEVDYPLGEPCVDDVDVIAIYDSNTDIYQAIATESAMLGTPEAKTLVLADITADGCTVNYDKQSIKVFPCATEPEPASFNIGVEAIDVVTAVYDDGTNIQVDYATVYVCGFGGTYSGTIETEICVDPPPPCTGSCTWTWTWTGEANHGYWTLTTPCPYGCTCGSEPEKPVNYSDPASDGTTESVACSDITP